MTAGMNETGRRALGAWRRVPGTVAVAALILCMPITASAKNAKHAGGQLPPGQAKKAVGQAPPGNSKKATAHATPHGQAKKQAARATPHGQAKKQAARATPPGQAKKAAARATPAPQARKSAARATPPGQAKKAAAHATPQGQAKKTAAPSVAPGHTRKAARTTARHRRAARRHSTGRRARAASVRAPAPITATRRSVVAVSPARAAQPSAAPVQPNRSPAAVKSHRVAGGSTRRAQQDSGPVSAVTKTVTRTVRDIAHVIPAWAKALMAALAVLLAVAAALILAAAYRNRRLRSQREALLADVGTLQAALLPVVPETVGALRISVAYRPAEGLAAGGDFYDVFPLDNGRMGILVGDVSGHGRESIPAATFTRHMVRAYLEAGLGPRESLQVAGHVADQHQREDDFATLVAAVHDPTAGTLSYASAGHPPPIIRGPAAHEPMIVASSPPLGVGTPTGLRQTTVPLPAGSIVCLFTDGLFEARRGPAIIGRKRVAELLAELGPDVTASELVDRVERDADPMHDDVAVCIISVDGDASVAATVRVEELEVGAAEIHGSRVRRFLEAAGVDPGEIGSVMETASRRAAAEGSVVLRVRLARDRSGVDVLPARAAEAGAPVAALSAKRATRS